MTHEGCDDFCAQDCVPMTDDKPTVSVGFVCVIQNAGPG
jgi:hypothetical protein